jgi:hypothetical protein
MYFLKHTIEYFNSNNSNVYLASLDVYYCLLFIAMICQNCSSLSQIFLFADDAKTYKCVSNISDCEELNDSGQQIYDWSEKWCMKLNVDKCKIF